MIAALRRIGPVTIILGWLAACSVCAATLYRGDWTAFGHFLVQFPRLVKTSGAHGLNWTFWLEGLASAYGFLLAGSIFFGLRRIRQASQ